MKNAHTYRLVIEKETPPGKKKSPVYNAYCPALGLADWGNTIDAAISNITKLILFHIESLVALGHNVLDEHGPTTGIIVEPLDNDARCFLRKQPASFFCSAP